MVFLPHTNTVILLEPYCGTIAEPGLPLLGQKILGAKIEIVNCLLVFYTRKWRFKLFSESSYCTATEAALVWVTNGSTSGSESLGTARLFTLSSIHGEQLNISERRLWKTNIIKVARSYLYACWLCFWFAFFRMKDSTDLYDFFVSLINNDETLRKCYLFSYSYKNLWDIGIYLNFIFTKNENNFEIPPRQIFP